jgi:hypothetical protein
VKQYVQTDLEAGRQVADTLAELIIGGQLFSAETTRGQEACEQRRAQIHAQMACKGPFRIRKGPLTW